MKPNSRILKTLAVITVTALLFLGMGSSSYSANYIIDVDGVKTEVDLNKPSKVTLSDGREVEIILTEKDYITLKRPLFEFQHHKTFKPAINDLGMGISQTQIITTNGDLLIVQEFGMQDPSQALAPYIKALTQGEVANGATITTEPHQRTLADGTVIDGKLVKAKIKNTEIVKEVLTISHGNSGMIILIQKSPVKLPQQSGPELYPLFWKSFKILK